MPPGSPPARSSQLLAGFVAFGLAALAGSVPAAVAAAPTDGAAPSAATDVLLANDFESDTYTPWSARGAATLAITTEGRDSAHSLSVTGRTADWQGAATSATALFDPGVAYSVTAWVKLPAATEGSAGVHFTVEATPADGGDNSYTWIGDNVVTTADSWVQIGGTYTMPAGLSSATLYVEAEGTTPYLLDDVLITGPGSQPDVVTVSAVDFEDGTTGSWTASGDPTLDVVDDADGKVLAVSDRTEGFDGLQSPAGIFTPGLTHTFALRARLAPDGPASSGFRFVMKPDYTWIGDTTITADEWTTVTGTFTVPGDADPAEYQVYLEAADATAAYFVDDILITAPADGPGGPEPGTIVIDTDFEDGLDGWGPRDSGAGAPTVELTDVAHAGAAAAAVTDRVNQGAGISRDVTTLFETGVTYELTAWLRFAEGQATDEIWLSLASTAGSSQSFSTLAQFESITNTGWTEVSATFTAPTFDSAALYFETSWQGADVVGNTSDFLVDDIVVRVPEPPVIEDLTGIHETTDFPVGVAIDSRETVGTAAQLLTRHFNNITPENHMKPEAWYDEERAFRPHEQAIAMMDFAQANDLGLYGHVLVWHSQTPAWFFQDAAGEPLTTSAADQQVLRDRMREHIFAVAESLSERYGPFGSDTNPLNAFDVVNEVVSDSGEYADGLRRSEWYRILGEEFIDLSFEYAEEAFNDVHAVAGTDPVTLYINDYNTEQSGKQGRYKALVQRLISRGVPIDGVGHQFHVSLATPVASLEAALETFAELPVTQAVTELDVTTGTPVTEARLIEQGYFFRDAFRIFRAYGDELSIVTVWGLNDGRSWRSGNGAPLIFDDGFQAKPAYYGAVDAELPARLRTANVFAGDVALSPGATSDLEWSKLPLHQIEDVAGFQLRWSADHLTAYVTVSDATTDGDDRVEFVLDGQTYQVSRDGSGDVPAVATERAGGYDIVAHLPVTDAAEGDTLTLDVQVTVDGTTSGWNTPGAVGTLTLIEELSYLEVKQAPVAPVVDGAVDPGWADATVVTTDKQVSGTDGAVATVRTLWRDQTLYVLAEVADPVVDVSGSDPWTQDSVEIYVDAGNVKNGPYRYDDMQVRINADNVVSFGTGDEGFQAARLDSATVRTDTGYTVEAAISLLEYGGVGTFHGLDFQVNDASDGARTSIRNWAEQEGIGYQTTARWGVGQLVSDSNVDITVRRFTEWDSDTGGGYCAEIVATNDSDEPVDWSGVVELDGDIYTAWNFERESLADNLYRINGVRWNKTLKPGASTFSVGYCATW
ncbi:endo-1,4-beta-xylanase [Solwaraspora sp. WMMD406]|uniref:endo-1,4-beta-xylanase n=1 Tax=Solwaraspora sp. WMMD406 TaxID=3016095 RepID=UPI002415BF9C|nr:endo-1,4-beta-xylanase [Solwaraspora sp. WMMD406]MDG4765757.1 endo-1,4-beta-xylanase [Solwaraspora sp. WMMD406]